MANTPEPAARKRTPPRDRQNAQGDHEGAPHRPEEFLRGRPDQPIPPNGAGELHQVSKDGGMTMPAKSKAQQKAAGAALAAKRGDADNKDLFGASKDMEQSMTESELEDLASTSRKKLPDHKD